MTNRDYLMRLSNEELANAIGRCSMACNEMKCESIDCRKCCLKWLEKERGSVKKWQIRGNSYEGFWLILYVNKESNWCMGVNEHGHISKMATDIVCTWIVQDVENKEDAANKFLERIFENL